MDLLSDATDISDRMTSHIRDADSIGRYIMRQEYDRRAVQETPILALKQNLRGTKRKAEEMTNKVRINENQISTEIHRLRTTVQDLRTDMTNMQEENANRDRELREMKAALHTGQTAYDFEKDLAAYIYPPGTPIAHGRIFTNLMNWLEEKKGKGEGREEGNRKWNDLRRQFGWSSGHTNVFFKMLQCRRTYAHPNVDYRLPTPLNFSREEERHAEDIRNMTIWLNEQQHTS